MNEEINESELSVEELEQLRKERQMKRDIDFLMNNDEFKRVVLDGFIVRQSIAIGSTFTGNEDQKKALFAITYLSQYLGNFK